MTDQPPGFEDLPQIPTDLPELDPKTKVLMDEQELAWETAVGTNRLMLYRVNAIRLYPSMKREDKPIRHVNWFATEERAIEHARKIEGDQGRVLDVSLYRFAREIDWRAK